mmetsp:Transcript_104154/g.334086  ORF Transcript_104154/g.334086 Transcript_104154/m.334086 type:complete len:215 (+) Transcript_104154:369-1013(+)
MQGRGGVADCPLPARGSARPCECHPRCRGSPRWKVDCRWWPCHIWRLTLVAGGASGMVVCVAGTEFALRPLPPWRRGHRGRAPEFANGHAQPRGRGPGPLAAEALAPRRVGAPSGGRGRRARGRCRRPHGGGARDLRRLGGRHVAAGRRRGLGAAADERRGAAGLGAGDEGVGAGLGAPRPAPAPRRGPRPRPLLQRRRRGLRCLARGGRGTAL